MRTTIYAIALARALMTSFVLAFCVLSSAAYAAKPCRTQTASGICRTPLNMVRTGRQKSTVGEQQGLVDDLVAHQLQPHRLRSALRRLERIYKKVSIDSIASGAIMPGAKVVVIGRAEPLGANLIFYGIGTASAQIFVKTATISKKQLTAVKVNCMAFCEAVVAGRVTRVLGSPGVAASVVLTANSPPP